MESFLASCRGIELLAGEASSHSLQRKSASGTTTEEDLYVWP